MEISGMSISGSSKPVSRQPRRSSSSAKRAAYGRRSSGSARDAAGGGSVFAAAGRSAVGKGGKPRASGYGRGGRGSRAPRAASSAGYGRGRGPRRAASARADPLPAPNSNLSRYKLAPGAAEQIAVQQKLQMERSIRQASSGSGAAAGGRPEVDAEESKYVPRKATGMSRAKVWSPEVENAFRMQEMGWRNVEEYRATFGEPERWENGFYSKLQAKKTGYFTYWSESRECLDKYLHRVKVFTYDGAK